MQQPGVRRVLRPHDSWNRLQMRRKCRLIAVASSQGRGGKTTCWRASRIFSNTQCGFEVPTPFASEDPSS
ncbi:hypothetical protein GN956_G24786 [Arapaima gigas]